MVTLFFFKKPPYGSPYCLAPIYIRNNSVGRRYILKKNPHEKKRVRTKTLGIGQWERRRPVRNFWRMTEHARQREKKCKKFRSLTEAECPLL